MPILKNTKHEKFAQALAKGSSADAAYQMAGYKANRGNAATLKANQNITDRVSEIVGKAADRAQITVDRLVEEMGKLALANAQDLYIAADDGTKRRITADDIPSLTRDQAAALNVTLIGDKAMIRQYDKRGAINDLLRVMVPQAQPEPDSNQSITQARASISERLLQIGKRVTLERTTVTERLTVGE